MTREELKKHCRKQIEACEMWAKRNGEEPHGKVYEEHKLILELLEQEPDTWSLDDAREDFMSDVYDTLDFLPTNNECNKIIDSFDRVTSGIKKEPKSEWQKDHEILKAYSDGANGVLDELKAEIAEEKEHAYADFEQYKVDYLGQDWEDALDSLPQDEFRYGMERCIDIINKFKTESEVEE